MPLLGIALTAGATLAQNLPTFGDFAGVADNTPVILSFDFTIRSR